MTEAQDNNLAVVHLMVREVGLDDFRRFVRSYRACPAGVAHRLIIAAKQFTSDDQIAPYQAELEGLSYELVHVADEGLDLGSYFAVARSHPFRRYCFINSRTELRVPGWLAKLAAALDARPGGIAGATGSWESLSSDVLDMDFPAVPAVLLPLRRMLGCLKLLPRFPLFPNPNLRTNMFVIERETLLAVAVPPLKAKWDTWQLESGRCSLTRQVLRRGGAACIVDAAGRAWSPGEWDRSETFWRGEQEGLLAADRQTRLYEDGDEARRAELRRLAWGKSR